MIIYFKLLSKGREVAPELAGHPRRLLDSLLKGEKTYDELVAVVKRHTDGEPRTNTSWWLTNMKNAGYISRIIKDEKK
jgi:hypothetical protein